MSKLEELIKELCPNGVEYKKLGDLGVFLGGLSGKSKSDFTDGNAKFVTYKNVYSNPALKIDIEDTVKIADNEKQNTVQYGDVIFTGSSETPDECGFSSVVTVKTNEKLYLNSFCFIFRFNDLSIIEPDFAKHLFRSESLRYQIGKTASGVTRYNVSKEKMKQVQIPLPPLAIQREIVQILDKFTLLSAELTTELTAELTARRKQYEFYRDKLLEYQEVNYRAAPLQELATIKTGTKPVSLVEYGQYEFVNAGIGNSGFTNESNCDGNVVTTPSRGQGGIGYVGYQKNKFWLGPLCYGIKSKNERLLLNKFLFYYLSNNSSEILKRKKEGGVPALNACDLQTINIKVPPIDIQERIVNVLDNFDAICSDLGIGLPAEIEKRQQQYEYYRDKLLTFDLGSATIYQTDRQTDR